MPAAHRVYVTSSTFRSAAAALVLTALFSTVLRADTVAPTPIAVSDATFGCISKLMPVRGFFVGSLNGHLGETLKVARSETGGVYPAGSVIQLVPTEVMVKQPKGFNIATHDWEFFELDVDQNGSRIRKRGFAEVVNRFGGNCFACHIKARPEWDFVCETAHGCDPIPLTPPMIRALQHTDPRCKSSKVVSKEDAEALQQLAELQKGPPPATAGGGDPH
jgi:hypothetical protein